MGFLTPDDTMAYTQRGLRFTVMTGENMGTTDKPHSRYEHVYAIVRADLPLDQGVPENSISVVKVMCSRQMADQEAVRLNDVNKEKACRYFVNTTHFVT
jgi:hypothetical protein